jgi:hypothetical protein
MTLSVDTLARIAREFDAELHAPFAHPRFAAALGRAGGWTGFAGRAEAMEAALDGALPVEVLRRQDKAVFDDVLWTADTRRFAESWSGEGLDERIVDPPTLRRIWLAEDSDYRTAMLLQAAWLHDHGSDRL